MEMNSNKKIHTLFLLSDIPKVEGVSHEKEGLRETYAKSVSKQKKLSSLK